MAIAPSKLGRIVAEEWRRPDAFLIRRLRDLGLVNESASDEDLRAAFIQARAEHEALPRGRKEFNSPNERVRVFLSPFLTDKGKAWAVPLDSLNLPDD